MQERIISADSHVTIRDEDVLARLSRKHHEAYREGKLTALRRFVGDAVKKVEDTSQPGLDSKDVQTWEAAGRRGAFDPKERLKDMDVDRVDAEVLYTDVWAGAAFYHMGSAACLEAFQAFNSAAIDFASVDPKRLVTVYILPIADVEEAVTELHRIAKEGARAVHIPTYPTDLGFPGYWDKRYDKLWAAIQELGMPISQHVASNANLARIRAEDPTPVRGVQHTLPAIFMAEVMAFWIVTGIFDRFPGLCVVLVESGLGWIPYFLERLDRSQKKHGWDRFGMLKEKPSVYFRRNMALTFEEDEFGMRNRREIGVENLMWATDYPHPDSTWPHSQEVIHDHFHDVPIEETRLMIAGNAARLYRL